MPSDDDAVAAPPRDEEKNNEKEKSGTANDEANTADAASSPSDDADARAATSTTENTLESVMAALQTPPDRQSEVEAKCSYSIVSQAGWFASVPALAARQVALQASLVRVDPKKKQSLNAKAGSRQSSASFSLARAVYVSSSLRSLTTLHQCHRARCNCR